MVSRHDETLALAAELLADMELSRLRGQALLMKANRLARLLGSAGLERFVWWELHGYPTEGDVAEEMLRQTMRLGWDDFPTYYASLAAIINAGDQAEAAIQGASPTAVSGEWALAVINQAQQTRRNNAPLLSRARNIQAAVVALPCRNSSG